MTTRRTFLLRIIPAVAASALLGCNGIGVPNPNTPTGAVSLRKKPLVLLILDGMGERPDAPDNAVTQAKTPFMDKLRKEYPFTTLAAAEREVGLPVGSVGSSEVGHMHIGGGRLINQNLTRIDLAMEDGSFDTNPTLQKVFNHSKGHTLHIVTLWSNGGIHSDMKHTLRVLDLATKQGLNVVVHPIVDGMDVPPDSAKEYLPTLEDYCAKHKNVIIGVVSGRLLGMDRNKKWNKVEPVYDALTGSGAPFKAKNSIQAVEMAYARKEKDTTMQPTIINNAFVKDGDVVLHMNFRADRARELTQAFTFDEFDGFKRKKRPKLGYFASLTNYGEQFKHDVMFAPTEIKNSFGEYIASKGVRQLRISETDKYAHVTYFFNGGNEVQYPLEERILVETKIKSYEENPEMHTAEVVKHIKDALDKDAFDVIICNFPNTDMVGHTGVLKSAIKAVECVDKAAEEVTKAVLAKGGEVIITSDHGNCEVMFDEKNNKPHVQHTTNRVPFFSIGDKKVKLKEDGSLRDIAPTMLSILGLPQPKEMDGSSLIVKK